VPGRDVASFEVVRYPGTDFYVPTLLESHPRCKKTRALKRCSSINEVMVSEISFGSIRKVTVSEISVVSISVFMVSEISAPISGVSIKVRLWCPRCKLCR